MDREVRNRLILAASATVFSVVLAELSLRIYQRVVFGTAITSVFPEYRIAPLHYSPFLAFGPRVNYQIPGRDDPALAQFDAHGFRTTEPLFPKAPGELRLVALGGSTTEDLWNTSGRHWPWVLQNRLSQTSIRPVRVLNGGMSAYATPHSLVRTFTDVVDADADILLVMHNINDLTAAYQAIAANTPLDPHYAVKYLTRGYTGVRGDDEVVRSRLLRLLSSRLRPQRARQVLLAQNEATMTRGIQLFQRNLRSIAAVARAHGVEPVFLTMPFATGEDLFRITQTGHVNVGSVGVGHLPERKRMLADLARYNAATIALANEIGVTAIDMAGSFEWDDSLFVDTVHYSDVGSEVFAERLAEELRPVLDRLVGSIR
jgi:lysophospholipase L1-like esterase